MAQTTFSGSSEKDGFSSVVLKFAGSFYDHLKDNVIHCLEDILDVRVKEGCHLLTVADFGTADGVTSYRLLEEIFRIVEVKGHNFQSMVFFEDMPENDFNGLFSKLGIFQSKLAEKRKIFFSAIGRSMYDQCLPNQSLDIAVSVFALHWLSEKPCMIENGLTFHDGSENEMRMFQKQAQEDWYNFLLSRGRELKKGGAVFALLPTDDGGFVCKVCKGLNNAWRKMLSLGKITKEEFCNTAKVTYEHRTKEELALPFEHPEIRDLGLRLVSVKNTIHTLSRLLDLKKNKDKSEYVRATVDFVQSWTRNSIYHGLSAERTADEKEQIVDDFYERVYDEFFEDDTDVTLQAVTEVIVRKDI